MRIEIAFPDSSVGVIHMVPSLSDGDADDRCHDRACKGSQKGGDDCLALKENRPALRGEGGNSSPIRTRRVSLLARRPTGIMAVTMSRGYAVCGMVESATGRQR